MTVIQWGRKITISWVSTARCPINNSKNAPTDSEPFWKKKRRRSNASIKTNNWLADRRQSSVHFPLRRRFDWSDLASTALRVADGIHYPRPLRRDDRGCSSITCTGSYGTSRVPIGRISPSPWAWVDGTKAPCQSVGDGLDVGWSVGSQWGVPRDDQLDPPPVDRSLGDGPMSCRPVAPRPCVYTSHPGYFTHFQPGNGIAFL